MAAKIPYNPAQRHGHYHALPPRMPSFPYDLAGICGPMRSGKDVLADMLVAQYGFQKVRLAAPLHQMWNICDQTAGEGAHDRKMRMVHEVLDDICRKIGSNIPYQHLVELSRAVVDVFENSLRLYPVRDARNRAKRNFLQSVDETLDSSYLGRPGIRAYALWRTRQALMRQHDIASAALDSGDPQKIPTLPAVVVPDVRFPEEATDILDHGGQVFILKVAPALLRVRLAESGMTNMNKHHTETALKSIPKLFPDCPVLDIRTDITSLPQEITAWLEERGREPGVELVSALKPDPHERW